MLRVVEPVLFAKGGAGLPVGMAVLMIVFFGLVGIASVLGLFASNETLESLSGIIGTKKPVVARVACGFGASVGFLAVFVTVLSLLGKL